MQRRHCSRTTRRAFASRFLSSKPFGTIVFEGDAQFAGRNEGYTFIEKPLRIEGISGAATLHGIRLGLSSRVVLRGIRFEDASHVVVGDGGYLVLVDCEFYSTNDNTYAAMHVGDWSTLEIRHCAMRDWRGTAVRVEGGSTTILTDSTFATPGSNILDVRAGASVTVRDYNNHVISDPPGPPHAR